MHGVQARISVHRNAALLVLIVIFSFAMSVLLASDLTTRASATSEGDGELPSFSASGRHIALESQVSDLGMGTATRISVAGDGTEENGLSYVLSISSDGQLGAFVSNASNVIAADNSGKSDIFAYEPLTHSATQQSVQRPFVLKLGFLGATILIIILVGFVGLVAYDDSKTVARCAVATAFLFLMAAFAPLNERIAMWVILLPFVAGTTLTRRGFPRFLGCLYMLALIPLVGSLRTDFQNSPYIILRLYGTLFLWMLFGISLAAFLIDCSPLIAPRRLVFTLGVAFTSVGLSSIVIDLLFVRLRGQEWSRALPSVGVNAALVVVGILLLLLGDNARIGLGRAVRGFLSIFVTFAFIGAIYDWLVERTLSTIFWWVPHVAPPLIYGAVFGVLLGMFSAPLTIASEIAWGKRNSL